MQNKNMQSHIFAANLYKKKKKYRQKGKILTPSPYNEYIFISADISSCVNCEEQKFKD